MTQDISLLTGDSEQAHAAATAVTEIAQIDSILRGDTPIYEQDNLELGAHAEDVEEMDVRTNFAQQLEDISKDYTETAFHIIKKT